MALTYDLGSIANYREVCFNPDGSLSAVTQALIFSTIGADIGTVTEQNAAEFFGRLTVLEKIYGPPLVFPGGERGFSPREVRAHIGLRTNVANKTRGQWQSRVIGGSVAGSVADGARTYKSAAKLAAQTKAGNSEND